MRTKLPWGLLIAASAAFAASAYPVTVEAQTALIDVEAAKTAAESQLDAGHPEQACRTLAPFLTNTSDDLILHFLLGQCFAGTGRPRAAIAQYRFILAKDSTAVRALAELGAAEAAAGDTAAARTDLAAALASGPPPEVRASLQATLDGVPPRPQSSGGASASVMYDSNADLGPLNDVLTLFGAPYRLTGTPPRREGDWAGLATANLDVSYPVDASWSFAAHAAGSDVTYARLRQFDLDSLSLSAGPSFQTDDIVFTANAGAGLTLLGNTRYSTSWGIEPDLLIRLSKTLTLDQQVNIQSDRYYTTSTTDGWSGTSTTALHWNFDGTEAYLEPKLTFVHQEARDATYTDNQVSGSVDYFVPLGGAFSLLVEPSLGDTVYRAANPAYGNTRHDETYALIANLGYEPGFWHSQIALGVNMTANRSNQSLYCYDRVQTTLQLKVPF